MTISLKPGYLLYLYIFLGALSAFPPLVTDMYLPALPAMAQDFHASASAIQAGLAMCVLGLAAGQLLFGPHSDKYGRKAVLGSALVLFLGATAACIWSPSTGAFNVCRFLQGLGGAGGVVLSRSVATDCYSGKELARALAIIGAINGIAPVTAPVIGGLFAGAIGWRGLFWILFALGVVLTLALAPFRESHPVEKRYRGSMASLFRQPAALLRDGAYVSYVVLFGLTNGVLFAYISSASFILQNDFGLSELMFGVVFAVNSLAIGSGSVVSLKFGSLSTAAVTGACGLVLASLGLMLNYVLGDSLWGYECMVLVMLFCVGILFPATTAGAMSRGRSMTGWASAIVGAFGFMCGGIVTPLVGLGVIQLSAYTVLAVCSAAILLLAVMSRASVRSAF